MALGRLNLSYLNLSSNLLYKMKCWKWLLSCRNIQESLRELDLSLNGLCEFPRALMKLNNLVTLKMNHNHLKRLPFGIRRMHQLRYLHLSNNKLISLPATFNNLHLDTLDIWENTFKPQLDCNFKCKLSSEEILNQNQIRKRRKFFEDFDYTPLPLWQIACNAVDRLKISYSSDSISWDLIELLEEGPQCACGCLCIDSKVYERAAPVTFENIKNLVFSRDRLIYVDVVLCGPNCLGYKQILGTI